MKLFIASALSLGLLVQAASAQSLGDFARKERERRAQQQKSSIQVSTDDLRAGKFDLSPPLDPARKSDLDYLLQQLSHPKPSPELLAAIVPLKDRAVPRLVQLLASTDPLKRMAPAAALTVLGDSEGLAAMAQLLISGQAESAPAAEGEKGSSSATSSDVAMRQKLEENRVFTYALDETKLGVWRLTEGSAVAPLEVALRLQKGPPIDVVGGMDGGQRIFNAALRSPDVNLRRGALALVRVASEGTDFGFQPDRPPDQNESAIQQITSFLTTQRMKVVSQLGIKPP